MNPPTLGVQELRSNSFGGSSNAKATNSFEGSANAAREYWPAMPLPAPSRGFLPEGLPFGSVVSLEGVHARAGAMLAPQAGEVLDGTPSSVSVAHTVNVDDLTSFFGQQSLESFEGLWDANSSEKGADGLGRLDKVWAEENADGPHFLPAEG